MEHLAIQLLRLILRLILFAWSGDWHKLDKLQARFRELVEQARKASPPGQKPRPARAPRAKAPWLESAQVPPSPDAPWPFEFAPELVEEERLEEQSGGEAASRPRIFVPPVPRKAPRASVVPSLAVAIRQPRMLRDAMVLTAALGPRDRGGRKR